MLLCACLLAACSRSPSENTAAAPLSASAAVAVAPAAASAAAAVAPAASPAAQPGATPPVEEAKPAAQEPAPGPAQKPTLPAAAAGAPKTFACGSKGQPACPAQAWMKANMPTAVAAEDGPALAKAFDYIAAHAPSEMPNWASIAKGGAASSRKGDIDAAKGACKACHDQYKAKYKTDMRDRPF
jgi:hypothetical protein